MTAAQGEQQASPAASTQYIIEHVLYNKHRNSIHKPTAPHILTPAGLCRCLHFSDEERNKNSPTRFQKKSATLLFLFFFKPVQHSPRAFHRTIKISHLCCIQKPIILALLGRGKPNETYLVHILCFIWRKKLKESADAEN